MSQSYLFSADTYRVLFEDFFPLGVVIVISWAVLWRCYERTRNFVSGVAARAAKSHRRIEELSLVPDEPYPDPVMDIALEPAHEEPISEGQLAPQPASRAKLYAESMAAWECGDHLDRFLEDRQWLRERSAQHRSTDASASNSLAAQPHVDQVTATVPGPEEGAIHTAEYSEYSMLCLGRT